jgi:excisionase family DNA binding protein
MSSGSRSKKAEGIEDDDRLLTVAEAARFLNISPGSLYHMIARPGARIPVIRLSSRCVRLNRSALMEWLETLSEPADRGDV